MLDASVSYLIKDPNALSSHQRLMKGSYLVMLLINMAIVFSVDILERNKELIRKRMDIGEHFTWEVIQSIVFIFLSLGERVHLTNRSITTNPLGNKECLSM